MIGVLVADGDPESRSMLAGLLREATDAVLHEAEDGVQAMRLGLQARPDVALLDLDLPGLSGIDVARTLRNVQPSMRIALQASDRRALHDRARGLRLPVFDKLEPSRAAGWAVVQIRWWTAIRAELAVQRA
jgi:CheY-like chemotaxis protein